MNPGCSCNTPFYRNLLKVAAKQLQEYYPDSEVDDSEAPGPTSFDHKPQMPTSPVEFNYSVINCSVAELAKKLADLPKNVHSQIAISRYEDQITCVVTEINRTPKN